jgi:putative nucleotidyltransferase with HDIG domain
MIQDKTLKYKHYLLKRLLVFIISFTVAISLLFTVGFFMIQSNKTKSTGMEIIKIHTQNIQTWLQSRKIELESIIQTLGTNINTHDPLNENLIRACKERPGYFETIFISDLEGRTNDCFKENHTITNRDYFHRIVQNNEEFVISDPLLSKTNNKPSIVIATRLSEKDEQLKGLFGATINLSIIEDFLKQVNIDDLGTAVLINNEGQFVAHSQLTYSMENVSQYIQNIPPRIMEEILTSQNGVIDYTSEQTKGAKELLFFETLDTMPNWKMLIHIPKRAFYSEIIQITVIAWSLLFASIILVIILMMRASKKITEPLETAVSEINRFNLKNLEISLPKTKIKEINQLTNTFTKMSKELKHSIHESKRSQDELAAAYEELSATNEDLEQSYQQLEKMSHNLEEIFETATQINQAGLKSEEEYLDFLLKMLIDIIDSAEYGSVALFENDKWRFVSAKGHDLQKLQQIDLDKAYHIKTESVKQINNILSNVSRMPEEKMKELINASKPIGHTMISELKFRNTVVGTISIDSPPEASPFTEADLRVFEAFTNFATAFLGLKRLFKAQTQFQHQLILAMIKILEIHDPYTKGHSEKVGLLSAEIAREMNFDEEEINEIFGAGLVHDIGKINIPNTILLKVGRLTKEEYDEIKKHPVWGAEILDTSENIDVIVKAVRHHHERWDGHGYPDGLSKTDIPLYSRIIAVADTYDAMTSDRSYKKAVSKDIAIEEIKNNSGEQFDPEIVEIFCRIKVKSK